MNKNIVGKLKRELEKTKEELKKTKEESEKYLNGWQRAKADYVNREHRIETEKNEWIQFSNQKIILKILPILDSFSHLSKYVSKNFKDTELVKGILQMKNQLEDFLEKEGVKKIKTIGEKFDPMLDEVIGKENNNKELENIIIKEVQAGYMMNGKVIKPAKVIIK